MFQRRRSAVALRHVAFGDLGDPSTQLGPLANARRVEAMETLVADAKAKGARVLAGGQRIGNRGYFFPLRVLADLSDDARAMNEEPFGPLALVNPVKTSRPATSRSTTSSLPSRKRRLAA